MPAQPQLTHEELVEFFALLGRHAQDASAGRAPSKPVVVRFELGEAGSWTLRASPTLPGECVRDAASSPAEADCTLSVSEAVLLDLANGRRKFAVAMMKGLISLRGDKSVFATELQPLFRAALTDFKAVREARRSAAQPTGALRVVVHGASVVADSLESYAVYLLEIFEGDHRWTLARRWSEVRALARRIRRMRPAVAGVPSLPRTLDFAGSLELDFLARRAKIVAAYLTDALEAIPTSVLVCSGESLALRLFLTPGDNLSAAPTPMRNGNGNGTPSMMSPLSPGSPRRHSGVRGAMSDASYMDRGTDRVSGFDGAGSIGMAGSRMVGSQPRVSFSGASSGNAAAGGPLSPGWTALAAPVALSPQVAFTPQTHRVADVYGDAGQYGSDDEEEDSDLGPRDGSSSRHSS